MRAQSLLVAGLVAVCLAFAAAGCDKEGKDYTCEDVADKMYDEDCEMWCQNDGYTIYVDTCAWYDDGDPYNFDEDLAESVCDDTFDMAEDEDCEGEFQSLLNCFVKHRGDDCAMDDCEDAAEDFGDCMDW